jgi:prepilin-type N-terminal cleavage/methylation domain-containing protein
VINIYKKNHGFTLIELLVTVSITLILLSGALGFFLDYIDKRDVNNSINEVKTLFQKAQAAARSGDLDGCDQLSGYRVVSYQAGSTTEISFQAECVAGTANPAETYEFPRSVEISPDLNYLFKVLHAGVDLPGAASSETITISNAEYSYSFVIYREGRFSAGDWE